MGKHADLLAGSQFTDLTLDDFEERFVEPFDHGYKRRVYLVSRFRAFVQKVDSFGIAYEMWVDGSFTTEKETPDDVDVVIVMSRKDVSRLSGEDRDRFIKLFSKQNKKIVKLRYEVHVFLIFREDQEALNSWQKFFGTYRDNVTPKGLARVRRRHERYKKY